MLPNNVSDGNIQANATQGRDDRKTLVEQIPQMLMCATLMSGDLSTDEQRILLNSAQDGMSCLDTL